MSLRNQDWTTPLTASGLTDVGRGERLVRAIAACVTVTYFIRWRGGCQRFLAANRWIGNRRAVTTVMRGKLMATSQLASQLVARRADVAAVPEPTGVVLLILGLVGGMRRKTTAQNRV